MDWIQSLYLSQCPSNQNGSLECRSKVLQVWIIGSWCFRLIPSLTCLWTKNSERNQRQTQTVECRTGIAEVTGSNPIEALLFFRLLPSNCLNWKIYCDDTLHFHLQPQYNMNFIYISQIYFRCRFIYVFASLHTVCV